MGGRSNLLRGTAAGIAVDAGGAIILAVGLFSLLMSLFPPHRRRRISF
jgi:hypothetical protein